MGQSKSEGIYIYKKPEIKLVRAWEKLIELFQEHGPNGNADQNLLRLLRYRCLDTQGKNIADGVSFNTIIPTRTGTIGLPVNGKILKANTTGNSERQLALEFDVACYGEHFTGSTNKNFKIVYEFFISAKGPETQMRVFIKVLNAGFWDSKPAKIGDSDNGIIFRPRFKAEHAMREIKEEFFPLLEK